MNNEGGGRQKKIDAKRAIAERILFSSLSGTAAHEEIRVVPAKQYHRSVPLAGCITNMDGDGMCQ
jgi:hypothetical protein